MCAYIVYSLCVLPLVICMFYHGEEEQRWLVNELFLFKCSRVGKFFKNEMVLIIIMIELTS